MYELLVYKWLTRSTFKKRVNRGEAISMLRKISFNPHSTLMIVDIKTDFVIDDDLDYWFRRNITSQCDYETLAYIMAHHVNKED